MRALRLTGPDGGWEPAPDAVLEPGQVDLWLFRSDSETLRHEASRALRTILSRYLGLAPGAIPISRGPQGKPHLAPELDSPVRFNLSHSGTLAAVAVTLGEEVGVDVERRAPRPRLPILADAMLAEPERPWYEGHPPSERTKAFFDLWTAKEACSKLIGRGLTMPFSAIAVERPAAAVSAVSVDHPSAPAAPCLVHRLPVPDGYSGAVALEASRAAPAAVANRIATAGR